MAVASTASELHPAAVTAGAALGDEELLGPGDVRAGLITAGAALSVTR